MDCIKSIGLVIGSLVMAISLCRSANDADPKRKGF